MTVKFCGKVDCIQRTFLQKILKINWPKKIIKTEVYEKTQQELWSCKIKRRSMNWIRHLLCLGNETPARKALKEYVRPCKKPPLYQASVSNSGMSMTIKTNATIIKELEVICQNRET